MPWAVSSLPLSLQVGPSQWEEIFSFPTVTAGSTIDVQGELGGVNTAAAGGNISATRTAIPNIISPSGFLTVGIGGIHPSLQTPGGSALQHTITWRSIQSPSGIDFRGNQFDGIDGLFSGGRLTINANFPPLRR